MIQSLLIDKIVSDLRLTQDNINIKAIPMASSRILVSHNKSDAFDDSFNYRSLVGTLTYLGRGIRPDIAYASHSKPKSEHGSALRWIGQYLKGTSKLGMIYNPDFQKRLEVHVDADFVGNWDTEDTQNMDTAKSRHGYVITYDGCPICWKSQLQQTINLSSCEAEYEGLSSALREAMPIMNLIYEMQSHKILSTSGMAKIHCKVNEDNIGAL